MAYGLMAIAVLVLNGLAIYHMSSMWPHTAGLAQGVIMNMPGPIMAVDTLYPFSWPRIAGFTVFIGASLYAFTVDMFMGMILLGTTILPVVLNYGVYSRIVRTVNNPAMKEFVDTENKFYEDEDKRTVIFQEELDKVMPEIWDKVKVRWKEEGLYVEELHEHHEPDESDSEVESATGEDD